MLIKKLHNVNAVVCFSILSDIENIIIPTVFTCNPGVIPVIIPKSIPSVIANIMSILIIINNYYNFSNTYILLKTIKKVIILKITINKKS